MIELALLLAAAASSLCVWMAAALRWIKASHRSLLPTSSLGNPPEFWDKRQTASVCLTCPFSEPENLQLNTNCYRQIPALQTHISPPLSLPGHTRGTARPISDGRVIRPFVLFFFFPPFSFFKFICLFIYFHFYFQCIYLCIYFLIK